MVMNNEPIKDDIVLNDDELVCILTETRKKATPKELVLQSVIQQMNDEYGFELSDMQREFFPATGGRRRQDSPRCS